MKEKGEEVYSRFRRKKRKKKKKRKGERLFSYEVLIYTLHSTVFFRFESLHYDSHVHSCSNFTLLFVSLRSLFLVSFLFNIFEG